jgi:EmrB/QacA subfamily drug resistance transporter
MPAAIVIAVVVTAVFMSNLDLWIVNVALVSIAGGLHGSLASASWVLNAYAVTLAAVLIPAGRLGDRIGHRRVFLTGIAVFTLASVACAFAPSIPILVVARIVQAAGAAAQLPTSLALLLASVAEPRRMAAARGWASVGAVSAVAGPVLGGLLVAASWRWVFLVNLPIGAAAWLIGRRVLPRSPGRTDEPAPDLVGSLLLVVAVSALTGALVQAPAWGWTDPRTLVLLVAALAGLGEFARRCARHPVPMIEPWVLKVRRFRVANGAVFLFSAAFAIMLLSNSLWCQDVWHYSALRTGLAMVPGPAMVPFVTVASARLVRRWGAGPVAAIGSVVFAASQLWRVLFAEAPRDYAHDLLPSALLGGIGVGLALGTLIAAGATALPGHRSATASAIVNSTRQIASALGVAVLVTVLGAGGANVHGYRVGWVVAATLALAAGMISAILPAARPGAEPVAAADSIGELADPPVAVPTPSPEGVAAGPA